MKRQKLWTGNFIAGTGINFLLVLNYYLLMAVIADYSLYRYHASGSAAGLAAGMFAVGALAARFFAARLMENIGRKNMLLLGISMEIAASVLYFFCGNISILCVVRLIHGIFYGIASTSVSTVVTGLIPKERKGEGIGYFMLSVTLGTAVGPFFGMFLIEKGGYNSIFFTCVITVVLCLPAFFLLRIPQAENAAADQRKAGDSGTGQRLKKFIEPKALPVSLLCAGIYFCYSGIISFLSSYAAEIHLRTAARFFFIIYSAAILLTRPFTGTLFDRKGERFVMLPAFFSFFAGMIFLSRAQSGAVMLISAVLLGFGVGVIQSCGLASAVKRSPAGRLSFVNATFYICLDAGMGIGPFLLGFLIPTAGYRGLYLAMAVLTVVLGILYLAVSRKSADRKSVR